MQDHVMAMFFSLPIEARREALRASIPHWQQLEEMLLAIGGTSVVPMPDPHLEQLVKRGRKFGAKSLSHKLEPCRCHGNVAYLWTRNSPKDFKIVTGWALTKDGLWRQHTWGRYMDSITIETTVKRTKYFGVVLSDEEAKEFVEQNDDVIQIMEELSK